MDSTPTAASPSLVLTTRATVWLDLASPVLFVPAMLASLAVACFLFVDRPVGAWMQGRSLPDGIDKLLEASEHFGTFYGHVLIFLLIFALDAAHRRNLVRLAATAWSAGLAANLVKLLIARTRPKAFDFTSLASGHGFLGLAPGLHGGSRIQGFPSAHTATAVAFAVALAHVYPRGRLVFFLLAGMVGLQRIATSSHFASDVLAGAIVGWLIGTALTSSRLGQRFDSFETPAP